MATKKYTENFSLSEIEDFIDELKDARAAYNGEEEAAYTASILFQWFKALGVPGIVAVTASALAGILASYFDTVQDTITMAIEEMEYYEDILQNNSNYNLVKLRITAEQKTVSGVTYLIPINFEPLAVHSINPPGWITA